MRIYIHLFSVACVGMGRWFNLIGVATLRSNYSIEYQGQCVYLYVVEKGTRQIDDNILIASSYHILHIQTPLVVSVT